MVLQQTLPIHILCPNIISLSTACIVQLILLQLQWPRCKAQVILTTVTLRANAEGLLRGGPNRHGSAQILQKSSAYHHDACWPRILTHRPRALGRLLVFSPGLAGHGGSSRGCGRDHWGCRCCVVNNVSCKPRSLLSSVPIPGPRRGQQVEFPSPQHNLYLARM